MVAMNVRKIKVDIFPRIKNQSGNISRACSSVHSGAINAKAQASVKNITMKILQTIHTLYLHNGNDEGGEGLEQLM